MTTWYNELSYEALTNEVYSTLSNHEVSFFMFQDKCYILDGTNYLVYDGATVQEIEPYIPTLTISREPTGGGTPYEDFNLLGSGFKDSFSADGTSVDFQLSLTNLDATAVKVLIDNTEVYENEAFTVNRTTGKVTFTTAPSKGTNNVIITAYKTFADFPNRIKKCTIHSIYGGANDTRVFLSGNKDMPNYVWRLGLNDPTYAPENGFYTFPDKVMGFAKQYDYLVVERQHGKHQVTFEIDSNGNASFPSKPINDQIGTIAPKTIQIIENNPVSLSKNGVYMLTASNVRDERNVTHISNAVDAQLLREPNLEKAIAFDFGRKYWLCVNGNAYIYDYSIGEWFIYDNVFVSEFVEINGDLYFGSLEEGLLYRWKQETDSFPYNDDGAPIKSYWMSKQLAFGRDELKKLVEKVFYSLKPSAKTSANIYYISDKKESDLIKTSRMDMFSFAQLDFTKFSFITDQFPQETSAKIKAKKITHFQLIVKNDQMDESLNLLSLGLKYRYQSYIK